MRAFGTSGALGLAVLLAACDGLVPLPAGETEAGLAFPDAGRPISTSVPAQYSSEDLRDERREAQVVMELADIRPGMTVADIGAGEGYYTVRLAERVGAEGRVLAQDISRPALERLGRRVENERLENISIKLGQPDNPQLPEDSFDRIFLVHVYHEVSAPYAFLWNMWPALNADGQIIVVEAETPAGRFGIPHAVLFCEFEAIGYVLVEFIERPDIKGYFARFARGPQRTEPAAIKPCAATLAG